MINADAEIVGSNRQFIRSGNSYITVVARKSSLQSYLFLLIVIRPQVIGSNSGFGTKEKRLLFQTSLYVCKKAIRSDQYV